MGYTNEAEYERAVKFVANQANLLEATLPNGLGLNDDGTMALLKIGVAYIQQTGEMNIPIIRRILDQLKKDQPLMRDDVPFRSDRHLDFLTSIEAAQEMAKEKLRSFLQPVAADKDASGTSLLERFNARTQWLKANNVHRPKVEAAPAPPPPTPQQKVEAEVKARIQAMADRINSSVGKGWNTRTAQFRKRLLGEANELLTGGRNLAYVEKYVAERIRDHENGSIR